MPGGLGPDPEGDLPSQLARRHRWPVSAPLYGLAQLHRAGRARWPPSRAGRVPLSLVQDGAALPRCLAPRCDDPAQTPVRATGCTPPSEPPTCLLPGPFLTGPPLALDMGANDML